jgi:hypothetical protein
MTMSPTRTVLIGTSISWPSRRTVVSFGANVMSDRIAFRARSALNDSSSCAMPNSHTTAAASSHSPSTAAPATAITIRVLMSSTRLRTELIARVAGRTTESAIAAR